MPLVHKGGSRYGMSKQPLLVQGQHTVAILSTTELNEDSVLRKEEMKSTRGIGLSALLIADATLWTGAAMTLISETFLFAASRAVSTVARSSASS